MAEDELAHGRSRRGVPRRSTRPGVPVVRTVLRPRPLEDVRGERVAFFGTAPAGAARRDRRASRRRPTAPTSSTSPAASADRAALARELDAASTPTSLVVEIKAAAIDVVAEEADRTRQAPSCSPANDVVPLPGEPDLDAELERLAAEATERLTVGV